MTLPQSTADKMTGARTLCVCSEREIERDQYGFSFQIREIVRTGKLQMEEKRELKSYKVN